MSSFMPGKKYLILDANVLIDYVKADPSVFRLFSEYVGPVHVVRDVWKEVAQISMARELEDLGVLLIEPDLQDAFAAGERRGALSFQDWICLLTAQRHGFTCVTNDKRLRKECEKENVLFMWGLELMLELFRAGGIPRQDAEDIGKSIQLENPYFTSRAILQEYLRKIRQWDKA